MAIGVVSSTAFALSGDKPNAHSSKTIKTEIESQTKRLPLKESDKKSIVSMYKSYEALYDGFLNYDSKSVEEEAQKLKLAISKIKHEDISHLLKFSQTKLDEIKSTKSRQENNTNFHVVSMALIHILKKYDLGPDINAYFCPMEKKKWIQNNTKRENIHNPYNAKMLNCGSKETKF